MNKGIKTYVADHCGTAKGWFVMIGKPDPDSNGGSGNIHSACQCSTHFWAEDISRALNIDCNICKIKKKVGLLT